MLRQTEDFLPLTMELENLLVTPSVEPEPKVSVVAGLDGTARVKPEYVFPTCDDSRTLTNPGYPSSPRYVLHRSVKPIPDDDAAESATNHATLKMGSSPKRGVEELVDDPVEPPAKKARLSGAEKKRLAIEKQREKKKASRGMNTHRKFTKMHEGLGLCFLIAAGKECDKGTR